MAGKQVSIKDPDLAKVGIALKRAALKARKLGFATNTPVYVYRNGKIIDIVAEHRKTRTSKKVSANGVVGKKTHRSQKALRDKNR